MVSKEKATEQRVRKAKKAMLLRIKYTVLQAPWRFLFLLPAFGVFALVWSLRFGILTMLPVQMSGFLLNVYEFGVSCLVIAISGLCLIWLLSLVIIPRGAKQIERSLWNIGLVDRCDTPPALVANKRITPRTRRLVFYSPGNGEKAWSEQIMALQDALDLQLGPIEYIGRNCIALLVSERRANRPKVPCDEEF